jgi:vancomycin resistance protein YoaR
MTNLKSSKVNTQNASLLSLLLVAVSILIIFVLSGFVSVHKAVDNSNFANGVYIDGIDLSGKSYDEARQLLMNHAQDALADMQVALVYTGEETLFDSDDLGITINYQEALDKAYQYNKDITDSLEQRFNKTAELIQHTRVLSSIEIDDSKLSKAIKNYTAQYEKDAVDAEAIFNSANQTFTYTKEENGNDIDTELVVSQIKNMVNKKDFSPLEISSEIVYPSVKQSDLRENTKLVAYFETTAYDSEKRNTNIRLMCEAVDGVEINPGEVFSVNDATGQRTAEKGFEAAPAIINGMTVDDIGGGICQLSGTLYNAALLADMEIVERTNHTWPSDYLPIGQDSTLNWDDKDLKIKNRTDYSMYISARFENQKVMVWLFGKPLDDGVTIKVQNEIVEELSPPKTEIRYTSELPEGFRETLRRARVGYSVKVYRIYYRNGVETERELVSWDRYSPLSKIVLVGSNNTQDK